MINNVITCDCGNPEPTYTKHIGSVTMCDWCEFDEQIRKLNDIKNDSVRESMMRYYQRCRETPVRHPLR